ncbi:hypothetical protein N9L68_01930 [bacterium]|nr:hypothetical protein [bacterium]
MNINRKPGNEALVSNFFMADNNKVIKKAKNTLIICLDPQSVADRRMQLRNQAPLSMNNVEMMNVYTAPAGMKVAIRDRIESYAGTNASEFIGPVELPDWAASWHLTFKEKNVLFEQHRIAVGGADDGSGIADAKVNEPRNPDDVEPVFYHNMPKQLYTALVHDLNWKGVLSLAVGDGTLALVCALQKLVFVGVTLNMAHSDALYKWLTMEVFKLMQDPKCTPLYDSQLVELLASQDDAKARQDEKKPPKPKSKAKGKRSKRKKAGGDGGEAGSGDGEDAEEPGEGDDEDPEDKDTEVGLADDTETPIAKRLKAALADLKKKQPQA